MFRHVAFLCNMPFLSEQMIVDKLLEWHRDNPRPLPWKSTKDPYLIWLSEIILQQTQVVQGIPYYEKFASKYPTVHALAAATEDAVLNDWQGLGYNSRARNMLRAARAVVNDHNGEFPVTADALQELPGIGSYTAAAVASFAFDEPSPVIDANVLRFITRSLGIREPIHKVSVKKQISELLHVLIARADPAEFNQAMMNFGAMHCTARSPKCKTCPFSSGCAAFLGGFVDEVPVKAPKTPRKHRHLHYLVVEDDNGLILRKRTGNDIWKGMYDFPCLESTPRRTIKKQQLNAFLLSEFGLRAVTIGNQQTENQTLSHQKIEARFYPVHGVKNARKLVNDQYLFVEYENLANFAVPKIVDCYFRANSIHL